MLEAASLAMGLPTDLSNLRLHCADAAAFLRQRSAAAGQGREAAEGQEQLVQLEEEQRLYDLVFMDAFDGGDNVPAALCTKSEEQCMGEGRGTGTLLRCCCCWRGCRRSDAGLLCPPNFPAQSALPPPLPTPLSLSWLLQSLPGRWRRRCTPPTAASSLTFTPCKICGQ